MMTRKTKLPRMLAILGIFYGLILVAGCALQRKLLYFPTKLTPSSAKQVAAEQGFLPWQNASGEIIGWRIPAVGESIGSILIVHGNGGCALDRSYFAQPMHGAGALNIFVLEYPGYGARQGSSSMQSWLAAGEEGFQALPKNNPIYLVSESLGTGVAAQIAKLHPREVAGMAMFVPYDSLPSLAQSRMPLLLPRLILMDRYEPALWLKDYRGPAKFVLAEQDEIIPPKFGQRLFDAYTGVKTLEIIQGAHHNEVAEQSVEWWRTVISFWKANPNPPPSDATSGK